MLYENSVFLWLALFLILFVCELFVPFRQKTVMSYMTACVACIVFCEYEKSVFSQCVFFLAFSFSVYVFVSAAAIVAKKMKTDQKDTLAEAITLCDIPEREYGAVYLSGKRYIIKNDSGKFLRKGDALQILRQELKEIDDV